MKNHSILALTIMALWAGSAASVQYSGGTGEPNDPYRIASAEDLNDIGNHQEDWDKHFILVNDINLAEYTGTQFKIIGNSITEFTGVFDGNDRRVWNFTWNSTGKDGIGLFGYVGIDGQIKNLGMENVDVNAVNGNSVGGLVGHIRYGTITNCYSSGSVLGNYSVGGLGGVNRGTIANCYSTGSVSGRNYIGGLLGENYYGTITNCYSTGSVLGSWSFVGGLVGENYEGQITNCCSTASVSGDDGIGGLVGWNYYGMVTNCYSAGSVSGDYYASGLVAWNDGTITDCYTNSSVAGGNYVGGLVGHSVGTITNCYSTGIVSGNEIVGGLVGNNIGTITNCYSTGGIMGDNKVGGLVGRNFGTISDCYSTRNVMGDWFVGGLVGNNPDGAVPTASFWDIETSGQSKSAGGTPKTTDEMKTMGTFTDAGWDFVEIWGIGEHQTYPFLRTEPAGDLNHDKKVDLIDRAVLASHWLEGIP